MNFPRRVAIRQMVCGNCYQIFLLYSCRTLIWRSIFLQYSAKLLKKPDQCRAVYACSHLFWVDDQDGIKDGERYAGKYPSRFNWDDLIDCMH
jgi:hypothetical protein